MFPSGELIPLASASGIELVLRETLLNFTLLSMYELCSGEIAQWSKWSVLLLSNSSDVGSKTAWDVQEKFLSLPHNMPTQLCSNE